MEIPGVTGLERIGAGSFAVVYRARQEAMSRDVAVKVLREELTDDDEARFARECRTLGSLSHHPNIVTLYGSGVTAEGQGYLILEYCPATANDRIVSDGPMPWRDALDVLAAVTDAVAFAHDHGVLHRDVKPHNILYSAFGTPQLADFGIARMEDEFQTSSGAFTGSLAFTAPEMFDGGAASPLTDVWSLASTAYTLVTGSPPYSRPDDEVVTAVILRAQSEPPPPLAPFGVPPQMESLLAAALARDPARRVPSAAALAAGFRELVGAAAQTTVHRPLPLPPSAVTSSPAYAHTVQERTETTDQFAPPPPPPPPPPVPVPGPPSPARRTSSGVWAWALGVIVVAALAVGAFVFLTGDDGGDDEQATDQPTSPTTTENDTPTTTDADETTNTSPPTSPPASRRLDVVSVAATSTAPSGIDSGGTEVSYEAFNLIDGRADTAWRTAGDGVGEVLSFEIPGSRLTAVGLIPGYDKVDPVDGSDRFTENRRVASVRWTFSDGSTVVQTFLDSREPQVIAVDAPAGPVTADILSSTGFERRDFVAVSEVLAEGY